MLGSRNSPVPAFLSRSPLTSMPYVARLRLNFRNVDSDWWLLFFFVDTCSFEIAAASFSLMLVVLLIFFQNIFFIYTWSLFSFIWKFLEYTLGVGACAVVQQLSLMAGGSCSRNMICSPIYILIKLNLNPSNTVMNLDGLE
jgi:hypothetical protein